MSKFNMSSLKPDMHQCTSLTDLDISCNKITDVSPLSGLDQLVSLNLASNLITNIDCFRNLTSLEQLKLEGNKITSIKCLGNLKQLSKIRLSDHLVRLTNPICSDKLYPHNIINTLQQIIEIDGLRVRGKGSDFFKLCNRNVNSLPANVKHNYDVTMKSSRSVDHVNYDVTNMTSSIANKKRKFCRLVDEIYRICQD